VDTVEIASPERLADAFKPRGFLVRDLIEVPTTLLLEAYGAVCPPKPDTRLYCMQSGQLPPEAGRVVQATVRCPGDCPGGLPAPLLTCTSPTEVGSGVIDLQEPAMRPGGLELLARGSGGWVASQRAAVDQPFGPWQAIDFEPEKGRDATFFTADGTDLAIVAVDNPAEARSELQLCEGPACQALAIVDQQTDAVIPTGLDGPSVASVDQTLVLAFNADDALYETRANATRPTEWAPAVALQQLNELQGSVDDPAIGPDGRWLVFGSNATGSWELWVTRRQALDQPLDRVELLEISDPGEDEREPELWQLPDGRLELYFRRGIPLQGSGSRIHRAICQPGS
jgi:hypothetical protein